MSSVECLNPWIGNLNSEVIRLHKDCSDLVYEANRLKWFNTFDTLKKFIKETIGLPGKWTSPGSNSKKFTSSKSDLILTWYSGKQKTLLFQGKDGNSLKETLINVCETTASPDNKMRASPESTSQPNSCGRDCRLDATTTIRNNSTINVICLDETTTNRQEISLSPEITAEDGMEKAYVEAELNSPASSLSRCGCPCGALSADIEGIKLDLVIMQTQMESLAAVNTSQSTSVEFIAKHFEREMFNEKERYAHLEKEKNKEINDLNNIIRSLEGRVIKAENERDSLKIALSNTPFPSGTCFDNTEYDNYPSRGVIDPSGHDNINRVSPSSVIELSPQANNNWEKTTHQSVDTASPTIVVKNSKTLTSEEQLLQYRGKQQSIYESTTSICRCPKVGSTTTATQRILKRRESKDTQSGISPGSIRPQQSNQPQRKKSRGLPKAIDPNTRSRDFPHGYFTDNIVAHHHRQHFEAKRKVYRHNFFRVQIQSRRPDDWLNYLEFVQHVMR